MIYFNINIRNPSWWDRFKMIKGWSGRIGQSNKYWDAEVMQDCELFRIEFEWTTKQDHAGVNLELGLAGYKIRFGIHDSRHWDSDANCWLKHT